MPYSKPVQIQEHVPLAPFTTLRIGGPARFFAHARTEDEVLEAVQFARARNLPIFVLGGGSNLVVADSGFVGLVLQIAVLGTDATGDRTLHRVGAGEDWNDFVRQVCEQGISGVECLAGIPGFVGGTPVQNVGAYGQEVAETIHSVRVLDLESLGFVELRREDCRFSYRRSLFNSSLRNRYLVTQVSFAFDPVAEPNLSYADLAPLRGTRPSPLDVYRFVRTTRDRKGMLIDPANPSADSRSAGSFFKNPVVPAASLQPVADALSLTPEAVPNWPTPSGDVKLPAAWLIERAGFAKGFAMGRVGISSRHTLALINRTGDATCAELLQLRDAIVTEVASRFGVTLEQEPVTLG